MVWVGWWIASPRAEGAAIGVDVRHHISISRKARRENSGMLKARDALQDRTTLKQRMDHLSTSGTPNHVTCRPVMSVS